MEIKDIRPYSTPKIAHDLICEGQKLSSLQSLSVRGIDLDVASALPVEFPSAQQLAAVSGTGDFEAPEPKTFLSESLQSVRLIDCGNLDNFLTSLGQLHRKLKRLEIVDLGHAAHNVSTTVHARLRVADVVYSSRTNLEELLLLFEHSVGEQVRGNFEELYNSEETWVLWRTLYHRSAQLRRLIYHERVVDYRGLGCFMDWPDFLYRGLIREVLARTELECLGICDHPELMRSYLSVFRNKKSLKVIHIRRSCAISTNSLVRRSDVNEPATLADEPPPGARPEFLDRLREVSAQERLISLVNWVFGDSGIRSVELIAYGDFSDYDKSFRIQELYKREARTPVQAPAPAPAPAPDDRHHDDGRGGNSYREIQKWESPAEWAETMERWKDFLGACPYREVEGEVDETLWRLRSRRRSV